MNVLRTKFESNSSNRKIKQVYYSKIKYDKIFGL